MAEGRSDESANPSELSLSTSLMETGPNPVIRYVGHSELAENSDLMEEWAFLVAHWIGRGLHPYFFSHTSDDLAAPEVARLLHQRLSERVEVGELPDGDQLSLF